MTTTKLLSKAVADDCPIEDEYVDDDGGDDDEDEENDTPTGGANGCGTGKDTC
jgi:hypothetical protein